MLFKPIQHTKLLKNIYYIAVIYIVIMAISYVVLSERERVMKSHEYYKASVQLQKRAETLIKEKREAIVHLALALSHDSNIKNALQEHNLSTLDLVRFSKRLRNNTPLKHVWFQIVDMDGNSFYRSWSKKRGDNLAEIRSDIATALKSKQLYTSVSVGRFDLSFKTIAPIIEDSKQIGVFEVIAKFNSIATKLKEYGVESVFLADKSYRAQLTHAFTKMFIDDYYVANIDALPKYKKRLHQIGIEGIINENKEYIIDEKTQQLICFYLLNDNLGKPMGYLFFFLPLSNIDFTEIKQSTQSHYVAISGIYLLVVLLIVVFDIRRHNRYIDAFNTTLSQEVTEKTKALHEHKTFLQEVIDGVSDTVMVIAKDYSIISMNQAARSLQDDHKIADMQYPKCYEVSHHLVRPCSGMAYPCPLFEVLQTKRSSKVMHKHHTPNGKTIYYELTATPLIGDDGEVKAIIEVGHDITGHMHSQEELRAQRERFNHLAHHDQLSGLPNRLLFIDRLEHAIESAKRHDTTLVLFFLDLDNFKQINDSLGHSAGDFLLQKIAKRLLNTMRSADTVARLGGDEFTILVEGDVNTHAIGEILDKLIRAVSEPVEFYEHTLYTSTSIGVSSYPEDGSSAEELLKNADAAMYKAKELGRNTYQFYTADMTQKAMDRVVLEASIRRGLSAEEFYLVYQPQYDVRKQRLIGMEALVRWKHPTLGELPPGQFIAVCEESNLIIDMGDYVLRSAAQQAVSWFKQGLDPVRVAVNLSVKQLRERDLIQKIRTVLEETSCRPEWIEIEVTEGYVMHDPDQAIARLQEISKLGIVLAMDDFGTGYSSLSLLKRLPIQKLKIDASFIRAIPGDEEDEAITRTIIDLAENMHLEVLAEGVEREEQSRFLSEYNCFNIQGYFYGRPMKVEAMTHLLESLR